MVKLRLTRMGSKKRPFYRVVAIDSKSRRDGKYIELLGTYNPLTGDVKISKEVALEWLKKGAQPSDTVKKILSHEGIIAEFHNFKQNDKQKVVAKTGSTFGKEVDKTVGYTKPGTKPKTEEDVADVVEEVKAENNAE